MQFVLASGTQFADFPERSDRLGIEPVTPDAGFSDRRNELVLAVNKDGSAGNVRDLSGGFQAVDGSRFGIERLNSQRIGPDQRFCF